MEIIEVGGVGGMGDILVDLGECAIYMTLFVGICRVFSGFL